MAEQLIALCNSLGQTLGCSTFISTFRASTEAKCKRTGSAAAEAHAYMVRQPDIGFPLELGLKHFSHSATLGAKIWMSNLSSTFRAATEVS
eukprot:4222613-Pyramimonas_sp.AAC.1